MNHLFLQRLILAILAALFCTFVAEDSQAARAKIKRRKREPQEVLTRSPSETPKQPANAGQEPQIVPQTEPDPLPLEPAPDALEPDPAPLAVDLVPQTKPDDGGDVVEIIDLGGDGGSSSNKTKSSSPPPMAPPSLDSFQFTGWARVRFSVGLTDTGAEATDLTATPFDRVEAQAQMHLRLRYARGKRFEAVVSGLLTGALYEQDARPPDSFNLVNGDIRTAYETTLREAQIGIFFPRFDLRIGQQRIPWGRGDAFTPNDVVNAYDMRDQLLIETEAMRLPTMALRGDLSLGPVLLSGVVTPFFQPNRFDSYGGNWALLQPDAPATYRVLANRVSGSLNLDSSLYPLMQPLLAQTALPPADVRGASAGLRFGLSLHRIDLDAYYHYGYARSPSVNVDSSFTATLGQVDLLTVESNTLTSLLISAIGQGAITSTYQRRHHVGLSAATPVGPLLLRGEFAADSQVVVPGADFQSVQCPSVEAVLGLEYQPGELGKAIILEGHYQYLDIPDDTSLLFQRKHNTSVAALMRWSFFRDHLQLEMRGVVGISPFSYLLRPQIAYVHRGFELRVGVTIPGGEDSSFGNYYRRNLAIYSIARYSF